jgi:hypothetical protein
MRRSVDPSCEYDHCLNQSPFKLWMSKDNCRRPHVWIWIIKWFSNYENLWTWNLWYLIWLNLVRDPPGLELWNTDTSGIIFSFVDMESEKWGQFYPELGCSCIRIIKLCSFNHNLLSAKFYHLKYTVVLPLQLQTKQAKSKPDIGMQLKVSLSSFPESLNFCTTENLVEHHGTYFCM